MFGYKQVLSLSYLFIFSLFVVLQLVSGLVITSGISRLGSGATSGSSGHKCDDVPTTVEVFNNRYGFSSVGHRFDRKYVDLSHKRRPHYSRTRTTGTGVGFGTTPTGNSEIFPFFHLFID